jgi:hypothetical protein
MKILMIFKGIVKNAIENVQNVLKIVLIAPNAFLIRIERLKFHNVIVNPVILNFQ